VKRLLENTSMMMARERSGLLLHGLVHLGHAVAAGVALACKMMVGCERMAPKTSATSEASKATNNKNDSID
jgi:hypothetical protein